MCSAKCLITICEIYFSNEKKVIFCLFYFKAAPKGMIICCTHCCILSMDVFERTSLIREQRSMTIRLTNIKSVKFWEYLLGKNIILTENENANYLWKYYNFNNYHFRGQRKLLSCKELIAWTCSFCLMFCLSCTIVIDFQPWVSHLIKYLYREPAGEILPLKVPNLMVAVLPWKTLLKRYVWLLFFAMLWCNLICNFT